MGCLGSLGSAVMDEETSKLLSTLDKKVMDYKETFEKNVDSTKKKQENQLKERHKKLSNLKENKEEITEATIKGLNKDELKVELESLANSLDKMHYIYELGLELVDPLKKITLNKLEEKAKSAPAITVKKIEEEIEAIKQQSAKDFLNSTNGKVLKSALEKKGMSKAMLNGTKKDLMKERGERRKKEREEFGIEKNEFDNENLEKVDFDFYALVELEYNDKSKRYKEFVQDKMIEEICNKIYE